MERENDVFQADDGQGIRKRMLDRVDAQMELAKSLEQEIETLERELSEEKEKILRGEYAGREEHLFARLQKSLESLRDIQKPRDHHSLLTVLAVLAMGIFEAFFVMFIFRHIKRKEQ